MSRGRSLPGVGWSSARCPCAPSAPHPARIERLTEHVRHPRRPGTDGVADSRCRGLEIGLVEYIVEAQGGGGYIVE